MATTAAASSSSSSTTTSAAVEESADEVKVFRSSAPEDDPNELAGSSADLNADKQELAMEADIESQADFSQRVDPIVNPFGPLPWPSPGSNFLYHLAALSPVFQVQQKLALNAMAQTYAAAYIARLSPHYMNLGGGLGFERPPAFSMPCTPSANGARNVGGGHQQQQAGPNLLQMGSPMSGLSGGLGGVSLSADRATNAHQRHHQHQNQQQKASNANARTPKREKAERRREKSSAKSTNNDKKDGPEHIKKPMNAFMIFMKENRHKYMDECGDKRKQSAELNKELGIIWQAMTRDEQLPYYEMAQRKREEHQKLYPNWTARENYAIHKRVKKRRTRERSLENNEQKKCRARFGVDNQAKWCKHCRRKKRCLNVRDADSPVQVSSTTNPTTPLSMAGTSGGGGSGFNHLIGLFGTGSGQQLQQQDSPHSSRKDCGQSNSELSRCSSTTSSTSSNMSADEGRPAEAQPQQQQAHRNVVDNKEKMAQQNGFKLELLDGPKPAGSIPSNKSTPSGQQQQQMMELLPKPLPNLGQTAAGHHNNAALLGIGTHHHPPTTPTNGGAFQPVTSPTIGFPFQQNPFLPFGMNFMPNFMKQ